MNNDKEDGNGGCPSVPKRINPWIKLAAGILGLILLVGGVIWGSVNTFAMKPEVLAVKVEAERGRQLLAEKSVETFNIFQKAYREDQERFRQEQERTQIKNDIKNWQQRLNDSYRNERHIRDDLQKNPNDLVLKNRLQEEQRLQQLYQQKLNELLR